MEHGSKEDNPSGRQIPPTLDNCQVSGRKDWALPGQQQEWKGKDSYARRSAVNLEGLD